MEGHKAKTNEKRTMTRTTEKGDLNANYLCITNVITIEELTKIWQKARVGKT